MRVPTFRERVEKWWAEEARVGGWVRGDGAQGSGRDGMPNEDAQEQQSVRSVARRLGVGFDEAAEGKAEGQLRLSAKMAVGVLTSDGLRPSEYWHVHTHG